MMRRAGARWREGAPDYVADCFARIVRRSPGDKTADRYTVIFGKPFVQDVNGEQWVSLLDMSGAPTHPQGVSLWGEYRAHEIAMYRYRNKHYRVRWLDLPEDIREHVIDRAERE